MINWNRLRSSEFCFTRPWSLWAFLPLPGEKRCQRLSSEGAGGNGMWTVQWNHQICWSFHHWFPWSWNWLTALLGASKKSRLAPRMHPIPSISILLLGIFVVHASEPRCFPKIWELWNIFTLNFPLPTSILLGLNMSIQEYLHIVG